MHKYLRAIGFRNCKKRADVARVLEFVKEAPNSMDVLTFTDETLVTISKSFGDGLGLSLCGFYDENETFKEDFYYPYLLGNVITTNAACSIQRHGDKDAFSGLCENPVMGISLIFYLQNSMDFLRYIQAGKTQDFSPDIIMSALSIDGKILLPAAAEKKELAKISDTKTQAQLLESARLGDPEALDALTIQDIDTYNQVVRRVQKEDLYSVVSSTFLPSGVECDHYTILGEILSSKEVENTFSGEKVYSLLVSANGLIFQLAINKEDLLGVPMAGRRFKGDIWLQGLVDFERQT